VRPVTIPPSKETRERSNTTSQSEEKPNKSQATKAVQRLPEKISKNIENTKQNRQPKKYLKQATESI